MRKPVVVHVLADGKRLSSIEGKVIPGDNPVYQVILSSHITAKGKEKTA